MQVVVSKKVLKGSRKHLITHGIYGGSILHTNYWYTWRAQSGHFWCSWSILACRYSKVWKYLNEAQGEFCWHHVSVQPRVWSECEVWKWKKVLYLSVVREIYDCIKYALLWYNIFSTTLEGLGFEINPNDRCVTNKVIKGTQCTMAWYVDDNKLLHRNIEVILDIIN